MIKNSILCASCMKQDFGIHYATDCMKDDKGREHWGIRLVCKSCGLMTDIAETIGYKSDLILKE